MKNNSSTSDIARQTLIQLAKNSLQPTPENYAAAYNEIANSKGVESPSVHKTLQSVITKAGKKNPKILLNGKAISAAVKKQDWQALETQLEKLLVSETTETLTNVNWSVLIRTLLKQLETNHKGITLTRKKEGLSRVLTNFSKDTNALAEKIQALISSWGSNAYSTKALDGANQNSSVDLASPKTSKLKDTTSSVDESSEKSVALLREMIIRTLDLTLIPLLETVPDTRKKAEALLSDLRNKTSLPALEKSSQELKGILLTIDAERESQQEINQSLVELLKLIASSLSELTSEDQWLSSQVDIVKDILSKPITSSSVGSAKDSLKELIHKQSNLKPAMKDAKALLKQMAETFISRLVEITESTDDYHQKIENHQQELSNIEDIDELNGVLKNVLDDTRSIGLSVQRTREEFHESQTKVTQAEHKIQELTSVLEYINEVANEDYLTGTLNRRGMDEALQREFSRADRHHTDVCVAMMDIDHFKKLNDSLGHTTGDEALAHFAKVIKDVKRATDVLARYGGEEFIIILPNTAQEDGIKVIERVQRELTKDIFMHSDEHVVITFSAGVAQRLSNETPEEIIPRADAALYEAKNAGRNRVYGALIDSTVDIGAIEDSSPSSTSEETRH